MGITRVRQPMPLQPRPANGDTPTTSERAPPHRPRFLAMQAARVRRERFLAAQPGLRETFPDF